jgi:hypothetical protein
MAQYPIKMLKDESGIPFVPLTTIQAVVGQEYIQSTLMAEEKTTGHFVITNDKLTEDDLEHKIIAVMFEEDITPTTNSYLKLNDGTEYLIYDENGTGPLLIKDFVGVICFLMKKNNAWQLVKTGAAAGGSGGGHTITDNDGNVMPQQSVLQFKGFGVSDNAGIGATVISTPALVNNLSTTESGTGPLDAYQGKILNDKFANYALSSSLNNYALKADLNSYLPLSGGTMTGPIKILGTAADKPLTVRGIVGCTAEGEISELHLQYQANAPIKLGNDAGYSISADGGQYTGNAATATKATQDGSGNVITSTYFKNTGGNLTGSPYIYFPVSAGDTTNDMPTALTYGRLQAYGTLCINADTDGSTTEYLILTAGRGKSSTTGDGLAIGHSTLRWRDSNVPTVYVQSGTPSAKQTGDIWFVT